MQLLYSDDLVLVAETGELVLKVKEMENGHKDMIPGRSDYKRPQKEAHARAFGDLNPNISAALIIKIFFLSFL